jgi:2-polyprenyl-3-methyl-5-hydroxy-6-metoxy-1,4-benzoquinol methylase
MSRDKSAVHAGPLAVSLQGLGREEEDRLVETDDPRWLRYFFARHLVAGKTVLDVGCGDGNGSAYLAAAASHVDAFDASESAIARARAIGTESSRIAFHCTAFEPFMQAALPQSYDVVTAFGTVEHLEEPAQLRMLEGIRRVLAPGGVALIATPGNSEVEKVFGTVRIIEHLAVVAAGSGAESIGLSPEEARRTIEGMASVIEGLMKVMARDADELSRARRVEAELKAERQSRAELEQMVSMRLIRRAKSVWDRIPGVKNVVKSLMKKLL